MDWSLQVIPTLAGFIGGLIAVSISAWNARSIHRERLTADQSLAERKFNLDKDLADKKLAFDKSLAVWRRRYDLADEILTLAYEARDGLVWARTPGGMSGEGDSREAVEDEDEALRTKRNSYYVPIERLHRETERFAALLSLRCSGEAHFGDAIVKPLQDIFRIRIKMFYSAYELILRAAEDYPEHSQKLFPGAIGQGARPDKIDKELEDAIAQIEALS